MNPALSDYQPTLAVVATWFEPRLHDETSSSSGPPVVVRLTDQMFCPGRSGMHISDR